MPQLTDEATEHDLYLSDAEGRAYIGHLTGTLLGEAHGFTVYLADDERVLVHDENRETVEVVDDVDSFLVDIDGNLYIEVMHGSARSRTSRSKRGPRNCHSRAV